MFAFLGGVIRLPARLDGERAWFGGHAMPCAAPAGQAIAYVRAEALEVVRTGEGLPATLRALRRVGPRVQLELGLARGEGIEAVLPIDAAQDLTPGPIRVRPRVFRLYPATPE